MSFTAKSMILDITDAYNTGSFVGLRSIDIKLATVLVDITLADISVTYGPQITGYEISKAFVTALSKIGDFSPYSWLTNSGSTNIRITIVFVSPQTFDSLEVNNIHNSGMATTYGAKNVKITISEDVVTSSTFGEAIANSIMIFDGVFDEHSAVNEADPQILYISIPHAEGIQAMINDTGSSHSFPVRVGYGTVFTHNLQSPFGIIDIISLLIGTREANILVLLDGFGISSQQNLLEGMGTQSLFNILTPHGIIKWVNYQIQVGTSIEGIQAVLNTVKGRLEGITSNNIQAIVDSIALRDEVKGNQAVINSVKDGIRNILGVLGYIAGGLSGTESSLLTITDSSISRAQALHNKIFGPNAIEGMQYIIQSLKDITSQAYQASSGIYLDGIKMDKSIGSNTVEMSFSQGNIHNEITISSISEELFIQGDPSISPGTPRLEIHIEGRVLFFLIEQREGSSSSFTLWGRDQTARDSSPWAESTSIVLETPTLASSVVAGLTGYSAVDWNIYDWIMPIGFEAEGTPTEIISSIVQEIGGVVRAQDDGSFLVRPALTVRPIDMLTASPVITYLGDSVVDFSHSKSTGEHYNMVQVNTYSPDIGNLDIEVESIENDPLEVGETAYIRVYKSLSKTVIESAYVTDGSITFIVGPGVDQTFTEEKSELVEFIEGIGETTYPISSITTIEWIGDAGILNTNWTQNGKTLSLMDLNSFKIARITYDTTYYKGAITGSNVETLLAVFFFVESTTTDVIVKTQAIAKDLSGNLVDKEGPTIEANYLTDTTAAVLRGEAWIDQNKYDTYNHEFNSPYNALIKDGAVIWLDCNRIGTSGNYYVLDYGITISGPKVFNTIKVVQWEF